MSSKLDMSVLGKRVGSTSAVTQVNTEQSTDGLELSEIVYKTIDFFCENPVNVVFEKLKDPSYIERLKKDIDDTRAIINPLITLPDGTILEGHSRLLIAKLLENEGKGLGRLPVRIVLTKLSDDELKRRVYLGNLSRFEIDEDTRILLYAEIWPDYFRANLKPGKKSDHGDTITTSKISDKLGMSVPQIKRDAAIFKKASKQVGGSPTITDIKKIRKEMNEERKRKKKEKDGQNTKPLDHIDSDIPLFQCIDELKINNEWNFAINVSVFSDYARLLNMHDYKRLSIVIEYLSERIINLEKTRAVSDVSGFCDS
jgi:hypothetical protein